MKQIITFLLFYSISAGYSQNLLVDGSLESHNTSGCDYNNNEAAFNGHYAQLTSIPDGAQEIDIIKNSGGCFGDPPMVGATKLLLAENEPLNRRDGFSFNLTQTIVAGESYDISWYMDVIAYSTQAEGEILIGISSTPSTFGTQVFSGTSTLGGGFTLISGTFVAPSNATYLTVQVNETNDTSNRCWIGVDGFELIGLGSSLPDCDVVTADVDTIIVPLDDTNEDDYTFAAVNWIKLTGKVESGISPDTIVAVRASQYIELSPQFESKLGTDATYYIGNCDASVLAKPNNESGDLKRGNNDIKKENRAVDQIDDCKSVVPPCSENLDVTVEK